MSIVVLVEALPYRPDTGAPVGIFLAGGGSRAYDQLGRNDWRSGVRNVPRFTSAIDFDQSGATGGALPSTAAISLFPSDKAFASTLGNLYWSGARISVSTGNDEAATPVYTLSLVGTVTDAKSVGGEIVLTIGDLSVDLNKKALPDSFAGTGDLEGSDAATGRVKRRTWGYAFNIEGRILDPANNIYEFGDPSRPLQAFAAVKDKGVAGDLVVVPWQGTALATLGALRTASAPSGGGAVAPSIACVKWWTDAAGPLTADIRGETGAGYVETAPQIAASIVAAFSSSITIANLQAALLWQSAVCGIHCGEASETVANLLDRLLLPVSTAWILQGDGQLVFRQFTWDNPVEQLQAAGQIERETVFQPLLTRKVGFQANYRKHSDAEISTILLTGGGDATYADGTPIEVLKPAQANADRTVVNTAAAILGQTEAATAPYNSVFNNAVTLLPNGQLAGAGGGQVTYGGIGGKLLGLLDNLFFGSSQLLEQAGGAIASLFNFKTSEGTSAGFFGQSAWATYNSLIPDTVYGQVSKLQGDGFLPATGIYDLLGGGLLSDVYPGQRGANVTGLNIASGIFGQGFGATAARNLVDNAYVPIGVNTQIDSGFVRTSATWAYVSGSIPGTKLEFNRSDYSGKRSVAYLWSPNTADVGQNADATGPGPWGRDIARMRLNSLPVKQGEVVGIRALAANHRCIAALYLLIYNKDGALIEAPSTREGAIPGGGGGGDNFGTMEFPWTINQPTAAYAQFMMRMEGTGESGPYLFFSEPWIGKLASMTSPIPPYSPGPADPLADQTGANTAAGFFGQGAFATISQIDLTNSDRFTFAGRFAAYGGDSRYFSASQMIYAADGNLVSTLKPEEPGGNRTETRTASAIVGQTSWATYTSLNPNSVFGQISKLQGDGFMPANGVYDPLGAGNLIDVYPGQRGANVTETRTAAAVTAQGTLATQDVVRLGSPSGRLGGLVSENNSFYVSDAHAITSIGISSGFASQGALATRSSVAYGDGYTFGFNYLATQTSVSFNTTTIRRADGSTSVSESLVVTELGIAASFYGQGRGATSNNLADLDPAAKAALDAAGGAATGLTAAFGVAINKVIAPGASITYEAAVYREAGGSNGNIYAQVVGGPAGSGAGLIGEGGASFVGAGEPGGSIVTGTYTNNTGFKQNFTFTAAERRAPTSAGGAIRQSQSYLIIRG